MYLNNWSSFEEMCDDFTDRWKNYKEEQMPPTERPEFQGIEVLLASYGTPCHEGYAFVLFRKDGRLYEVNGSHCSCYGLENQWEPEETSIDELRHRIKKGYLGAGTCDENPFATELSAILDSLEQS